MEELQEQEPAEAFRQGEEHEGGDLDQWVGNPQPSNQKSHGKSGQRLRECLNTNQSATGHVLQQSRDEAGQATDDRALSDGEKHGHNEGEVGRDTSNAQRGHHAPLREVAAERHQEEQGAHGLSVSAEQARHVLLPLAREEQDLLDAGEVHGRRQHGKVKKRRTLVLDGDHTPDRKSLREQIAEA